MIALADRVVTLRRVPGTSAALRYVAFNSLADMAAAASGLPADLANPAGWAGATMAQAVARARFGDLPRVAGSDAMLSKVEQFLDLSTLRTITVPSVAGGAPCVPAFIAGHPMAMRTRRRVAHDRGEMILAVEGFTPSEIDAATITRRGAAVLALARAAAMLRPVRLVSFAVSGGSDAAFAYTLPLDSAPIDLARAAWVFGAPEFTRQLRLPIQEAILGGEYTQRRATDPRAFVAHILGIDAGNIVVAPGFGANDCLRSDAAAIDWVKARLDYMTHA
jgi:hypothetical protein